MKYNCIIKNIDDDEITIKIGNTSITGFCNTGVLKQKGDTAEVEISLYGILNIDKSILESDINFEIDLEELFDYGYLDGQKVKIDTMRIDLDFV